MQKGECTNIQSLFKGCNAVWCCICSLKEPERCDFHNTEGLCGYNLPDSYRECKGYDMCKIYRILTERKNDTRK